MDVPNRPGCWPTIASVTVGFVRTSTASLAFPTSRAAAAPPHSPYLQGRIRIIPVPVPRPLRAPSPRTAPPPRMNPWCRLPPSFQGRAVPMSPTARVFLPRDDPRTNPASAFELKAMAPSVLGVDRNQTYVLAVVRWSWSVFGLLKALRQGFRGTATAAFVADRLRPC